MATLMEPGIRDTIARLNEGFMATYRSGNATDMGELYTEDGQLLPPNSGIVHGKQAIAEFWGGAMGAGIRSLQMTTGEVELHGDTAIEVSTATLHGDDDQLIDEVKYIVVWKREHGDCRIHRDIFNSCRAAG
jgi:ketosteroid isomerase-like protein